MSNPPLSRFVHRVRNPLLDQAATFRLTHRVHVATTVATTKSSTNRSFFLFLCPPLTIGLMILIFFVLIFVSLIFYIFWFSVIIFVWILRKCEKHDKNGFSRAFSRTQIFSKAFFEILPYTWKCFHFWKIFSPAFILHSEFNLHWTKRSLKYNSLDIVKCVIFFW